MKKISQLVSLRDLDGFKDPRDCLQSKIFMNKFYELINEDKNKFNLCIYCNQLYTDTQSQWMRCPNFQENTILIDVYGREIAQHEADPSWNIQAFIQFLKSNTVSWRWIFWKFWARLQTDECKVCGDMFTSAEMNHCMYHTEKPFF